MNSRSVLRWASFAVAAQLVVAEDDGGPADTENWRLVMWLFLILAVAVGLLLFWRVYKYVNGYLRTIACLNNDTQRFFAAPNTTTATLKRYVFDAPISRKRHNREFMLSRAVNMGTLPTRLQAFFLIGYFAVNVAFCVIDLPWSGNEAQVGQLFRNRTGTLSVMNMIPLFIMAGRSNPLIKILDIPFDTFNMYHRWFGRIVVLEGIAHSLGYVIPKVQMAGWSYFNKAMKEQMIITGVVAGFAFLVILLQSPSPVRHAFYEVFLHLHIALVIVSVAALWYHLQGSPQMPLLYVIVAAWAVDRFARLAIIIIRNVGRGGTKAEVDVLPGDAVKVTLHMARPWKFTPGQHAYLYMPSIGLWMSHPFSLAWSDEETDLSTEKLPMSSEDLLRFRKTSMSFVIRRRTGFTEKLYNKASASPNGKYIASAFVEGPYGSQSLRSYGTVMLFAAGIGITHQVPHVRDLVAGHANGTVATRKLVLVWIIQSPEHLEWIRPWMTQILSMERRREILKILLFVTRPRSTKEIHSPSSSVQMFPGKPNVDALVQAEQEGQIGAMAVSVCGTGSLSDDVRRAARVRYERGNIDFVENAFTW
ncbi:MAG: hypothetical protein Q9157_004777 [Trypethelium eluteriae]